MTVVAEAALWADGGGASVAAAAVKAKPPTSPDATGISLAAVSAFAIAPMAAQAGTDSNPATGTLNGGGLTNTAPSDAPSVRLTAAATAQKTNRKQGFTIYRIDRLALPITIRMPGPLTRSVSLRSVKLTVNPVASLMLGLAPAGTVLIQGATIHLQVLRGTRTIFKYESTLGQLFPNTGLNYRVLWHGTPTPGSYDVLGVFRPQGAPSINIDQTVKFTAANVSEL